MRLMFLLLAACLFGVAPARADERLHLFAAGSLTDAMAELLAKSGIPANRVAAPIFGPSVHCGNVSNRTRQRTSWRRPICNSHGASRASVATGRC